MRYSGTETNKKGKEERTIAAYSPTHIKKYENRLLYTTKAGSKDMIGDIISWRSAENRYKFLFFIPEANPLFNFYMIDVIAGGVLEITRNFNSETFFDDTDSMFVAQVRGGNI